MTTVTIKGKDKHQVFVSLARQFNKEIEHSFYDPRFDDPVEFVVNTKNGKLVAKAYWSDELETVAERIVRRNTVTA